MNTVPLTIESLAARVTALELDREHNTEAHGKIYARLEIIEQGHAILNADLQNIREVLDEIRADVKSIKERPQKRMDAIITEVIKYVVIAALGAVAIFK